MSESLISHIVDNGIESLGRFYSVYRGIVMNIDDPFNTDRLQVYVPDVDVVTWALPFGSHGSEDCGFRLFPLPKKDDVVYVLFEKGNPGHPLWTYHGWSKDQSPIDFTDPDVCGVVTPKGTKIIINDRTGEIHIEAANRLSVVANGEEGIVISANNIHINSSQQVVLNNGDEPLISINRLTDKLNELVNDVENLRNLYNTHVHPSVSSPTSNQATKPVNLFNKEDFSDESTLH